MSDRDANHTLSELQEAKAGKGQVRCLFGSAIPIAQKETEVRGLGGFRVVSDYQVSKVEDCDG